MTQAAQALQNSSENRANCSKKNNQKKLSDEEIFLATKSQTGKMLRKIDIVAYGVWCEMLDHPEVWSYYIKNDIVENLSVGYSTVKKKLALLIEYGLIDRIDKRGNHGHFKSIYYSFQEPQDHAKKNLLADYNRLMSQNINRDGSQNLTPAIISYQEENIIKNTTTNYSLDNNNISSKSVPKERVEEQKKAVVFDEKKAVDFDSIMDECGVVKNRYSIKGVLIKFADKGNNELKKRLQDCINRGKGAGYLHNSLRDMWPIEEAEPFDPHADGSARRRNAQGKVEQVHVYTPHVPKVSAEEMERLKALKAMYDNRDSGVEVKKPVGAVDRAFIRESGLAERLRMKGVSKPVDERFKRQRSKRPVAGKQKMRIDEDRLKALIAQRERLLNEK